VLRRIKVHHSQPKHLSHTEVAALVKVTLRTNSQLALNMMFLYITGLRIEEARRTTLSMFGNSLYITQFK
jgi:integrase